jgi:cobalt-zinc-cadmium efflux system outer membrane protein
MRGVVALCACVLFGGPLPGFAQELSVDDLVAMALQQSPALGAARTRVEAAEGRVREAGLRPNPMVGTSRQEMLNGPGNQTMVEVQWPLDLFRRPARERSARQEVEAVALTVADRERLLSAAVREQAGQVLEARQSLGILREIAGLNRQLRDLIDARVREGAQPRLDLDILEVEVQRSEADVALQEARVDTAQVELRVLVGLEPRATVTVAGTLESAVGSIAAPDARVDADVLGQRADLRESIARVALAEARLDEVRQESRVDASVFGAYGRAMNGFPLNGLRADGTIAPIREVFHDLRLGVQLVVPLRDRNQGAIAEARAERRGAELEAEAVRLDAGAELEAARARRQAAQRAVALYDGGARDQARRNVEVLREAYELGRNTLLDVLAEQRRLLDVEMAYTQALAEAYQADTALRRARGDVR